MDVGACALFISFCSFFLVDVVIVANRFKCFIVYNSKP